MGRKRNLKFELNWREAHSLLMAIAFRMQAIEESKATTEIKIGLQKQYDDLDKIETVLNKYVGGVAWFHSKKQG